jgi:hypothetical protein
VIVAAMGTIQLLDLNGPVWKRFVQNNLRVGGLFLADFDVGFQAPKPSHNWIRGPIIEGPVKGTTLQISGRSRRDLKNKVEHFELRYELTQASRLLKTESQNYSVQLYSQAEITELFSRAGLSVRETLSDYSTSGLDPKADRWAVSCELV